MIYYLPPGTDMFSNPDHEAIINTTNTTGVMGAGIAKVCMDLWPEPCKKYNSLCKETDLKGGSVTYYPVHNLAVPHIKYMICFATKQEVYKPAQMLYVQQGLERLIKVFPSSGIKSLGVPPLGCGLGGLQWKLVKPLIIEALKQVPDVDFYIYEQ
jgi:O-acetyl-ADP-ribose deacetylase (regulator of RNase III)